MHSKVFNYQRVYPPLYPPLVTIIILNMGRQAVEQRCATSATLERLEPWSSRLRARQFGVRHPAHHHYINHL